MRDDNEKLELLAAHAGYVPCPVCHWVGMHAPTCSVALGKEIPVTKDAYDPHPPLKLSGGVRPLRGGRRGDTLDRLLLVGFYIAVVSLTAVTLFGRSH